MLPSKPQPSGQPSGCWVIQELILIFGGVTLPNKIDNSYQNTSLERCFDLFFSGSYQSFTVYFYLYTQNQPTWYENCCYFILPDM